MRRRPSFRRDTELQAEVRRVNKLVQNKQSRIRVNKGLEVVDVETEVYKEFNSRREIERYLKQMNKFLDRKADFKVQNEKGAELQYSDVQEIERTINKVNRQKKKQWDSIKDLPYLHKGQETGVTVGQQADPVVGIGDPKYADVRNPITFNPNRFRSEQEFLEWKKNKEKVYASDWQARQGELLRGNYLKAMGEALGYNSFHIQDHIQAMQLDVFIKVYYSDNNAKIGFIYDFLEAQKKIIELERVWGVK